jgi:hypothetical protein
LKEAGNSKDARRLFIVRLNPAGLIIGKTGSKTRIYTDGKRKFTGIGVRGPITWIFKLMHSCPSIVMQNFDYPS